jgi:predicted RNA methylase
LVNRLKSRDEDHEFYPTTNEIIAVVVRDIRSQENERWSSVLDIGAGNGKVLKALREGTKRDERNYYGPHLTELFAIEKSEILCQELDRDILVVGTDFMEQSLLSKPVDVIFCNPPYSEYETWCERIIRQACASAVYLVIPIRWESSVRIKDAVAFREAEVEALGQFDFEQAEDRRARAKVHVLKVSLRNDSKDGIGDAFQRFFNEQFADVIGKFGEPKAGAEEECKEAPRRAFDELVVGPSYPEALVNLYNQEMEGVEANYKLLGGLDVALMKEFGIVPERIMKCLAARLKGLKNDYWQELFGHLSAVTDRLTSKSRKQLVQELNAQVNVDFTLSNIWAVLIWVVKNANEYIDGQLLDAYEKMIEKCNIQLYKSNQRTWGEGDWRYGRRPEDLSHYALDYRIVTHRVGGIHVGYSWDKGLDETAVEFMGDLLTIGKNLGFRSGAAHEELWNGRKEWISGEKKEFYCVREGGAEAGRRDTLFDVRAFKNRNLHLRLNQEFMLALNVEHGRLRGWLRSGQEASEELREPSAARFFNANRRLSMSGLSNLLSCS